MNVLTMLLRLPFLPVQGVVTLGELIQQQAEQEFYDPSRVRRELEEAEEAHLAGEVSDRDLARREAEAVGRLVGGTTRGEGS
jgi:hypothetical protein